MQQKFPLIISVKYKSRINKKRTQLTSFDLNLNVKKPRKKIVSRVSAETKKKEEEIDINLLSKTVINGFAFLYNKYDDIITYLIKKHKDKQIKLDINNIKLQESLIKIFGEPREYITFKEYIELLELGYKLGETIGKHQTGLNV